MALASGFPRGSLIKKSTQLTAEPFRFMTRFARLPQRMTGRGEEDEAGTFFRHMSAEEQAPQPADAPALERRRGGLRSQAVRAAALAAILIAPLAVLAPALLPDRAAPTSSPLATTGPPASEPVPELPLPPVALGSAHGGLAARATLVRAVSPSPAVETGALDRGDGARAVNARRPPRASLPLRAPKPATLPHEDPGEPRREATAEARADTGPDGVDPDSTLPPSSP